VAHNFESLQAVEVQLERSEKGSVNIAALICNLGTLRPFYLRGGSTGNL